MKTKLITALIVAAAATGTAVAEPFDFQRQFDSSEYAYGVDTAHLNFAAVDQTAAASSLEALMLSSDVDGIAPNRFVGEIEVGGPSRISLYEVQRGSPELSAS